MTSRKNQTRIEPSSFRDVDGFLYYKNNRLLRQVNKSFKDDFDFFLNSGLYKELVSQQLLTGHKDVDSKLRANDKAVAVIEPEKIEFISYPYEWCFSQLKDAAQLTLKIQLTALEYGMTLKDASAFNVQFIGSRPIFIDSLSFEIYKEGEPWVAYRQFCQHFLAPLSLMSYIDVRLNQLLRTNIDGLPLDLTSKLLPKKTWMNFGLMTHAHMHARTQKKYAKGDVNTDVKSGLSKTNLIGLIKNLEATVSKLKWNFTPTKTEWGDYYNFTNYSKKAFQDKKKLVGKLVSQAKPSTVWDMGANDGEFSKIATEAKILTIAMDSDEVAVENNYLDSKRQNNEYMQPLLIDITNPSPALGWGENERKSVSQRGRADMILALAIIHHLSISDNVPFTKVADYFSSLSKQLIIEFVPKSDSQVKKLLKTREDIFENYTQDNFEQEFSEKFVLLEKYKITDSDRWLYLYEAR